jgi:hypothetical protein
MTTAGIAIRRKNANIDAPDVKAGNSGNFTAELP